MRYKWQRVKMRVVWSWQGLLHVWRTEGSMHQWIWANICSAALAFLLPLSGPERGMLLMGGIFVLALECLNTAIERVVDDVSEVQRDRAKQAKDSGSAAVALGGAAVGLAWICVLGGLLL